MNKQSSTSGSNRSIWGLLPKIMNYRNYFKKWNFVRSNINNLCNFTLEELINNEIGITFLKKYLGEKRSSSYDLLLENWHGYKLCKKIIKDLKLLNNRDVRDELFILRPSFLWEDRVLEELEVYEVENNEYRIKDFLEEMAKEFIKIIEGYSYFNDLTFDVAFDKNKIMRLLVEIYDEQ